jgi:hypothetical protein
MNDSSSYPLRRHIWFERCGLRLAAPMEELQEVLQAPTLRPLPAAERSLAGLMTLRERILPVFDPWLFASSERPKPVASAVVLVLGDSDQPTLGLLVERVGEAIELPSLLPLTLKVRLPVAFAGQCQQTGQPRVLVVNPGSLAAALGLVPARKPGHDCVPAYS